MPSYRDDRGETVWRVEPFDPRPSVNAAADALEALGADYALIGGLALDAWGIPRATKDADFAVPIGSAEPAADRIKDAEGQVRPLRIGGVGVRNEAAQIRIDLIDRRFYYGRLYQEAIAEAKASGRRVQVGDRSVPLVSLEHLLAMKLVSGEPKDDVDARRILDLRALDYRRARAIVEQHLGHATANRLDTWGREVARPEVPPRGTYKDDEPTEP
jgi:hypothetical protein